MLGPYFSWGCGLDGFAAYYNIIVAKIAAGDITSYTDPAVGKLWKGDGRAFLKRHASKMQHGPGQCIAKWSYAILISNHNYQAKSSKHWPDTG